MSTTIVVGGNERQARAGERIRAERTLSGEESEVLFIFPCWTKNWNKTLRAVKRYLPTTTALIITTDVPTRLGETLREAARRSSVPWCSAPASGTSAIRPALANAATIEAGRE